MGYHGTDHSYIAAQPQTQPHFGYGTGNTGTAYSAIGSGVGIGTAGNAAAATAVGAPYLTYQPGPGTMGPPTGALPLPIYASSSMSASSGPNPYSTQGHYYSDTGSLSSPSPTTNYQQGYTYAPPSMYSQTAVPFPAPNLQQSHNANGAPPPRPQPTPASPNPFESFRNE